MANFSFDIISDYNRGEINNVFMQAGREIANRYDFKNTPAGVEWIGDKTGFVISGNSDMQLDAITDILRRGLINRGQNTKLLDTTKPRTTNNFKMSQEIPFIAGLDSEKAKALTKAIREEFPKAKPQVQGESVRVSSSSKDELQKVMNHLRSKDFDFPIEFTNYR